MSSSPMDLDAVSPPETLDVPPDWLMGRISAEQLDDPFAGRGKRGRHAYCL